ncbi:hypothetical protein OOJ09_25945 [Mesorhizobium qingshengii]|uniref:SMODS and SLOG-associating 2TM effector domain-containing protein n=1 Tax=Mesorhizobium qingshengii TaxID=1165689 RepID=A0ABT4R1F5_9HYPH|nr:hypothetical protein [Mesorhizobium qingshengii]MCZ8547643.1 hypothetical protein [Mesorhizobium qingshengii]
MVNAMGEGKPLVEVDWRKTDPVNIAMIMTEYEKRLAASHDLYSVLDDKARWLLTTTIALGSALAAYVFSLVAPNVCSGISATTLAALFFLSSIYAAIALQTRSYLVGARIPDAISEWKPLLEGGTDEALLFAKMRFETIAKAIAFNDESNDRKAVYLKRAIWFGCLAAPVAALLFIACHVFLLFTVPAGICPAIVGLF